MNRIARRARVTLLLALLLIAGFVFFIGEYMANAEKWILFSGSPHVYNGSNIGCGVITDRNGVLLLDMRQDRTYAQNALLRASTIHWIGDRYGNIYAPAMSRYASELAGYQLMDGVYSYGQNGGRATLTLSAKAQTAALEAMGDYKGTLAIYNYKTGELLCAVTTPTYDPDNIPDIAADTTGAYDGVYLNRFTQSVYIPGSIFKIVTLAAALEEIPDIQERIFHCTGSYQMGSDKIVCEKVHREQSLKDAFSNSCNCAFAQISEQLGGYTLARYAEKFQITQPVQFDGITTAAGNFEVSGEVPFHVAWSAIGQYKDEINPCRFMTFVGAVAAGGEGVKPYLVQRITVDGATNYESAKQIPERLLSENTASVLKDYLRNNVEVMYGAENFPGLTVCAKTGTAQVDGQEKPNAMIAGFVADNAYPFAFVVAVEGGGYGGKTCVPILSKVLTVCKNEIDAQ